MAAKVRLRTLRGIMKELKLLYGSKGTTRKIFGYSFLMSEYRRSVSADEQVAEERSRDAENFLCMLTSERKKQELQQYYKGAGESKIETIAQRVGLEVPNASPRHNDSESTKT